MLRHGKLHRHRVHTPTDSVHDSLPSTPSTSVPPSPTSPNKPETQRDSYFPPPSLPPSPASSPSPRINTNPGKRSHARSYISAGPHPPLSRLTHLLTLHLNVQQSIASEQEHMLSVLEIKSRRRAWSNGVRVGILGSQGHMGAAGLGLSMPVRSSPLARCVPVVAGDEWISVWDDDEDDDRVNRPLSPTFGGSGELEIVSRESDLACLFPVTEDDDEEAMEDVPLGEWKPRQRQDSDPDDPQDHPWVEEDSQAPELADMEAGLIPPHRIPSPPPPHVPRRRTKSMRATIPPHPLPLDTPAPFLTSISAPDQLGLLDHDRPVLQRLSPNSLLCQPLAQKHALIGDVAGEFTLAMDLPRKVKVQGGGRYEDEDWLTMRSSDALSRC
ncbi:hypothetical protein GLOTRDRAFT_141342 [Gloeophyllum trabeum ATCC 11539]|uniref:Uncharacterized protein n=1 Tax=Gloeophyllum trabeum (strain ATCC 11539 / FP-39264 / Madison 617) TaxID=670483 RepID=S7REF9_GLOTA|nr:uncharacterized protein GLOTRDRAFT_141342 [Gloeophyllum trabeum ATCC 11539]EPQ50864.1 hypothetical protein GLOTRDRAFT_141342 [Gloeophyllum trabeum ATCC 11539]